MRAALLTVTLLIAALTPHGAAQGGLTWTTDDEFIALRFDERDGASLEEFLAFATTVTGVTHVFDPCEVDDVRVRIVGPQRIRVDACDAYVRAVLRAHDFDVEPLGPSPGLARVRAVAKSSARRRTGTVSRAPAVPHDELERYCDDRGTLIASAIPLTSRAPCDVVDDAGIWLGSDAPWLAAHDTRRAVHVVGFGHDVWRAARFIRAIDRPTPPPVTRLDLEHADADDVLRALDDHLPADAAARVTAVPRSDSLLVVGEASALATWIAALDVP